LNEDLFWTVRALLILEGSVKRAVDPAYWVRQTLSEAAKYDKVVISDLRYRSELAQLQQYALEHDITFVSVRVERFESTTCTDSSERDLDDTGFDVVLSNKGTLEQFQNQVQRYWHFMNYL